MTLKQIKAMFAPGQRWHAVRTGPGKHRDEVRTVRKVRGVDLVFAVDGSQSYHTTWPKAGEVIEARPGFLRFRYEDCDGVQVSLELL